MIITYQSDPPWRTIKGNDWTAYDYTKHKDPLVFDEIWEEIRRSDNVTFTGLKVNIHNYRPESRAYYSLTEGYNENQIWIEGRRGVFPKITIEKDENNKR